jgi:hypothetical protein
MSRHSDHQGRNRIVIEASSPRHRRGARPIGRRPGARTGEGIVALTVIAAAALATFMALFLTSRPYDPMNSTLDPVQTVPVGSLALPSPRPSPSTSSTAQPEQAAGAQASPTPETEIATVPDDAGIQARIERTLAADSSLSKLDVSTLVEAGKVTIVGSVRSADLKQRVEKAISSIKGVVSVDNQLVITEATP